MLTYHLRYCLDRIQARALIKATFPEAPLRSRTVGFPESGSDLGYLINEPSLIILGLNADTHIPQLITRFTT